MSRDWVKPRQEQKETPQRSVHGTAQGERSSRISWERLEQAGAELCRLRPPYTIP